MTDKPEQIEVRGIDVVPYEYAIWCTVADSEPFANTIEHRSWSDNGEHIWLMLGTHNFYKCAPEDMVKVVPTGKKYRECSKSLFGCDCGDCFLARRPKPLPEEPALVATLNQLPDESRRRIMAQVKP